VAEALVDATDFPLLSMYRWHLRRGYAFRSNGGKTKIAMHREIMGTTHIRGHALEVDHINRNKLDNRRANLRRVPTVINQHNRVSRPGSSSRFRGVTWHRGAGKWQAQLKFAGRGIYVGLFTDEAEAAEAVAQRRAQELEAFGWGS
jgi:hypothetical protein